MNTPHSTQCTRTCACTHTHTHTHTHPRRTADTCYISLTGIGHLQQTPSLQRQHTPHAIQTMPSKNSTLKPLLEHPSNRFISLIFVLSGPCPSQTIYTQDTENLEIKHTHTDSLQGDHTHDSMLHTHDTYSTQNTYLFHPPPIQNTNAPPPDQDPPVTTPTTQSCTHTHTHTHTLTHTHTEFGFLLGWLVSACLCIAKLTPSPG